MGHPHGSATDGDRRAGNPGLRACGRPLALVCFAAGLALRCQLAWGSNDHLFVLTSSGSGPGNCAALELDPPWSPLINLEPVGQAPAVRYAAGRHYVVNGSPEDEVQIVDAGTFETVFRFSVGPGTNPRDLALIDATSAYVTRYDSRWLLRVDLTTGAPRDSLDLGIFADPDGLPEMAMMALDGNHLFVQLQRRDRANHDRPVAPGLLAVVDVTTQTLVDVEPDEPGLQAIRLTGTNPGFKMQVEPESRRLFVSTPGEFHDRTGGIDAVDLDALRSLGFVFAELMNPIGNFGGFVMASAIKGYVITHTDLVIASHLAAFSRVDGSYLSNPYTSFGVVVNLACDPTTAQLYFPDPGDSGIHVIDTITDVELTQEGVPTGFPPVDLVVVRASASGISPPASGTGAGSMPVACIPSPSRGPTRIVLTTPGRQPAQVAIFDLAGRLVRRLADAGVASAAAAPVIWDGRDARGARVPAGVYWVRVSPQTEDAAWRATGRIVIVR